MRKAFFKPERNRGRSRADVALARNYHRNKLNRGLEIGDDEGLLRMIWAVNALQSIQPEPGRRYFRGAIPDGAVTTTLTDALHVHKWELETLANEILAVPKSAKFTHDAQKFLIADS